MRRSGAYALGLLAVLACLLALAEAQGDFPTMYTDWEAKIEAARMGRNMSFSRWEIYSPTHDRLRIHYGPTWDRQVSIEYLDQDFKYRVAKNSTYPTGYCWTEPLNKWEKTFYVRSDHAASTTELLRYTPETETKLDLADKNVRGIRCDAWQHKVNALNSTTNENRTITITHHFAASDWNVIEEFNMGGKSETSPRPLLRLVVTRDDEPEEVDSWDFVGMKPYTYHHGDFNPCNMFGDVKGCGCDMPFRNLTDPREDAKAPALPSMYQDWTAEIEETNAQRGTSYSRYEIFSQSQKKMKMMWGGGSDTHVVIEDFDAKIKYRVTKNETYPKGMCWKVTDQDRADTYYYMQGGELRSTEWLMGYNVSEETYVTGEHRVRGMPVDVWHRKTSFGVRGYHVYHAFAKSSWDVSSFYNRSSVGGVKLQHERPLARIALVRQNDSSHELSYDYIGMQPYKYDAADFEPCQVFPGVLGCDCDEANSSHSEHTGETPTFPGVFKQWSAVVNTIHAGAGFSTSHKEIYTQARPDHPGQIRIDSGYYGERATLIKDLSTGNNYHVIRNRTFPDGFCTVEKQSVFKTDTYGVSSKELMEFPQMVNKGYKVFVPGDFEVRGIPVHLFESEIGLRGKEYHVHHYFTAEGWTNKYVREDLDKYVDVNLASFTHVTDLLVRITLREKETGHTTHYDFIDYQPYKFVEDDFDPCTITGNVEGCGCDGLMQDLCKLSEAEAGGLAAGLFFLGWILATLVAWVYCKFRNSRRTGSYSKYNDDGI
ncbi:hypothetical protein HOP50_04g33430 [Chloropicon primus]|nr:hypothetical protein HOP50_04g33430 [Chloropicon primus]